MIADAVLVKFKTLNGVGTSEIDDIIIIENKLSGGTAYTARQNVGWGLIENTGKIEVKALKEARNGTPPWCVSVCEATSLHRCVSSRTGILHGMTAQKLVC